MPRKKKATGKVLSFDLDLTRIKLGRITKSARTRELAVYNKRKGILDTLINAGKLEIVKAWIDDRISIEELHALNEQQTLFSAMEVVLLGRNLWIAIADTIGRMGASNLTRARYQVSLDKLRRIGATQAFCSQLGPAAIVGDLEHVNWAALMAEWGGSPADWNHLRRAVSHFLSKLVGKSSPRRHTILAEIPRKTESARPVFVTMAQFIAIRDLLPAKMRPVPMVLLLTGMRRTEYLAANTTHLLPSVHGVMIPQTEADSSSEPVYIHENLWHWIAAGIPAPLRYKQLRIHWKRACAKVGVPNLRFHDLRHVLALWALEAGAPVHSVMAALRHESLDTTARYLRTIAKKDVAKVIGAAVIAGEKRCGRGAAARRTTGSASRSRRSAKSAKSASG